MPTHIHLTANALNRTKGATTAKNNDYKAATHTFANLGSTASEIKNAANARPASKPTFTARQGSASV